MKEFYKIFMICLALMTPTFSAAVGASAGDSKEADAVRMEFESRCPKPQWWDRVSNSGVNIYTYDDLLKYWQNKDRSESQFFKAAYQAILDYPLDTDIVVTGIKLMDYTSKTYRHRIELQKYALEKHFTYKSPYGKPGDTIAGVARNLARLYNRADQYDKSVDVIVRLLEERESEINDHLLELLHLTYAEALHRQNRTDEAISVLEKAVKKYNGSWEKRLYKTISQYGGRANEPSTRPSTKVSSRTSTRPAAVPSTRLSAKPPTRPPTKRIISRLDIPRAKKPWWENRMGMIIGGTILALLLIFFLRSRSHQELDMSRAYPQGSMGTDSDVERLVMEGHKMGAIKLYRSIHNVGLKDSKEAVEEIGRRLGAAK